MRCGEGESSTSWAPGTSSAVSAHSLIRRNISPELYTAALSLDDPLQAFFFRATWINVTAWGVGYILAGRHPTARGPVLIAGAAGKLAYFGACLALFLSGSGNALLLAFGIVDVILAGFFVYVLWLQRAGDPPAPLR